VVGRIRSLEKSSEKTGNPTCHFPASSIVSENKQIRNKYGRINYGKK
jgi:hypothetical protein